MPTGIVAHKDALEMSSLLTKKYRLSFKLNSYRSCSDILKFEFNILTSVEYPSLILHEVCIIYLYFLTYSRWLLFKNLGKFKIVLISVAEPEPVEPKLFWGPGAGAENKF